MAVVNWSWSLKDEDAPKSEPHRGDVYDDRRKASRRLARCGRREHPSFRGRESLHGGNHASDRISSDEVELAFKIVPVRLLTHHPLAAQRANYGQIFETLIGEVISPDMWAYRK